MLVTALGLLLGGRADTGAVRTGAKAARVEGVVARRRRSSSRHRRRARRRGRGRASCCWAARSPPRAVRGPSSAAPRSRRPRCRRVGEALVAVHGQSDQHRLLRPEAQRDALDALRRRRRSPRLLSRYRDRLRPGCARSRPSCARCSAPRASAPARPTCCASAWRRSRRSTRSRARRTRWPPRRPGSGFADTLRTAAETAREALSSDSDAPDALGAVAAARRALESVREHDPEAAAPGRPGRRGQLPARRRGGRRRVLRHRASRPTPRGSPPSPSGGRR